MKSETQTKLALFAENAQAAKEEFAWQNPLTRRLAALLYAQESRRIDCRAVRRCQELIKSGAGLFSMFRGNMSLCVAAFLALSDSPERLFGNTLRVYELLKNAGLHSSDYLVIAAYQLAAGADPVDHPAAVERTRAFYSGMKAYHRFYTGQDDYIFAAMLGLSDADPAAGTEHMERLYSQLKNEFRDKNGVQALTQVLVLGGTPDEAVRRVLALRGALKERRLRFDRSYALPSLGVLALLPADIETLVRVIEETRVFLRAQKGFGAFSVCEQELLLFAAAATAWEYMEEPGPKNGLLAATLSTGITNIIIAQQAAMIAAVSASGAAAASSSH